MGIPLPLQEEGWGHVLQHNVQGVEAGTVRNSSDLCITLYSLVLSREWGNGLLGLL